MKGNPVTVTSESFQDMAHMKAKKPAPLTTLRRKMLMFCEMRSLTWVVSAERRDRMSPAGETGVECWRTAGSGQHRRLRRLWLTCVVLVKEADFLPYQDSVEVVPDAEVQPGEGQGEDASSHSDRNRAAEKTGPSVM